MEEEGHTVKFIRACAYGEKVCARYQDEEGFMVAADMWIRIAQMCRFFLCEGGGGGGADGCLGG